MPPDESSVGAPARWLAFAREDLDAAVDLADGHPRQAAFLLQQAAEKALKGFLLSNGWTLRKTHDLDFLLDEAT